MRAYTRICTFVKLTRWSNPGIRFTNAGNSGCLFPYRTAPTSSQLWQRSGLMGL